MFFKYENEFEIQGLGQATSSLFWKCLEEPTHDKGPGLCAGPESVGDVQVCLALLMGMSCPPSKSFDASFCKDTARRLGLILLQNSEISWTCLA